MDAPIISNRIAQPEPDDGFADTAAPDIELPFRTRAADAAGRQREDRRAQPRAPGALGAASRPLACAHRPLLDELMAAPAGLDGLEVEVKQDQRVVGTWELAVSPQNASAVYVSQAKAALHVCVSARGDPRATGAFLVLSHWWVNAGDDEQASQLYEELTTAILARIGSLTERIPEHAAAMPPYVLYLVDGRTRKIKFFSLPRLAAELLKALGEEDPLAKLPLQIAYGRGLGASPAAATMPADLAGFDAPATSTPPAAGVPWNPANERRRVHPGEVFVREQLSEENLRWARLFETRLG